MRSLDHVGLKGSMMEYNNSTKLDSDRFRVSSSILGVQVENP